MPDTIGVIAIRAAACIGALLLGACSTESTKHEREFDKLLQGLPGKYDNRAQARNDTSGEHTAIALVINPVNSMAIGQVVMFERETAYDDPRRILAQHVWTFELDKKKEHMVQSVYVFKEPRRWQRAVDDPYLMQSMMPDDLTVLSGCKLVWSKSDYGFAATTNAKDCQASAGDEGLLIEQSAEVRGTDLLLNEQLSGSDSSMEGAADSPSSYRFQRRSGPSQKQ
jgi:CpeT/CpcT family (DUF1001)